MDQGNAVVCTAVLQQSFLISQRDLKLALGFIVCNGITFHEARYSGFFSRFYANAAPQQHVLFEMLPALDVPHNFSAGSIKSLAPTARCLVPLSHLLPATNR